MGLGGRGLSGFESNELLSLLFVFVSTKFSLTCDTYYVA